MSDEVFIIIVWLLLTPSSCLWSMCSLLV